MIGWMKTTQEQKFDESAGYYEAGWISGYKVVFTMVPLCQCCDFISAFGISVSLMHDTYPMSCKWCDILHYVDAG